MEFQYPPDLKAKVTLHVKNMPWDEALEIILRENNLTWEMHGKTIVIKPAA